MITSICWLAFHIQHFIYVHKLFPWLPRLPPFPHLCCIYSLPVRERNHLQIDQYSQMSKQVVLGVCSTAGRDGPGQCIVCHVLAQRRAVTCTSCSCRAAVRPGVPGLSGPIFGSTGESSTIELVVSSASTRFVPGHSHHPCPESPFLLEAPLSGNIICASKLLNIVAR